MIPTTLSKFRTHYSWEASGAVPPEPLESFDDAFLKDILATPITKVGFYNTTLKKLLGAINDSCCNVLLRGSATLKLLGLDNLKKLAGIEEIPPEIQTLIQEQLNTPLNDIDLHIILPGNDPVLLEEMRNHVLEHLSESLGVDPSLIQEKGLDGLLKWRGIPGDNFEIMTLGNVDLVFIAQELQRPNGVFLRDIAIDIKGGSPAFNNAFGGGLQAILDLFQRVIRPGHPEKIGPNDWARALLHMIKGYDLKTDEADVSLLSSATVENSLALIVKKHFVHSPKAVPVFKLQALISLFEEGYALPALSNVYLDAKIKNFEIFYKSLQSAVFTAYAKGSPLISFVGDRRLRFKIPSVPGFSCIIEAPKTVVESDLESIFTEPLEVPRACPNLPKTTSLRLQAAKELYTQKTKPHQSQLPQMILERLDDDYDWIAKHPRYQWLKLDRDKLEASIFKSLLQAGAYYVVYGLAKKSKLVKRIIPELYKGNKSLGIALFLQQEPDLETLIRVRPWMTCETVEQQIARAHLLDTFEKTARVTTPFLLTTEQESSVLQILVLCKNKNELLRLFSNFTFESGFEFAQVCQEHFVSMSGATVLYLWERISGKLGKPPEEVVKARRADFEKRFEEDPEFAYLSIGRKVPKVLSRLVGKLIEKKEFSKAQKYALELGDQEKMRQVAVTSPASRELLELIHQMEGDTLAIEVRCIPYLRPLDKQQLFKRLAIDSRFDAASIQIGRELAGGLFSVDCDPYAIILLRNTLESEALALLRLKSSWKPTSTVADALAEILERNSDEKLARRVFELTSQTMQVRLARAYQDHSLTWLCRHFSNESPSVEALRGVSIRGVRDAVQVLDALTCTDTQKNWREIALDAGVLLPGLTPNLELLRVAGIDQRQFAWDLCRNLVNNLAVYEKYIPYMSIEDLLEIEPAEAFAKATLISRLLDLGKLTKALSKYVSWYDDLSCNGKLLNTLLSQKKLSETHVDTLAKNIIPDKHSPKQLLALFLLLDKFKCSDSMHIKCLTQIIIVDNTPIIDKKSQISTIAKELAIRLYNSENKECLNQLANLLTYTAFLKFIKPANLRTKTTLRTAFFYLLHILLSRCETISFSVVNTINTVTEIGLIADVECQMVATHLMLVGCLGDTDVQTKRQGVLRYLSVLQNNTNVPKEVGIHKIGREILNYYGLSTLDSDLLIMFCKTSSNVEDLLEKLQLLESHECSSFFFISDKFCTYIDSIAPYACNMIKKCSPKNTESAITIANKLSYLIHNFYPVSLDSSPLMLQLRDAVLTLSIPDYLLNGVSHLYAISSHHLNQIPSPYRESLPRIYLVVIDNQFNSPTAQSIAAALLSLGTNCDYFMSLIEPSKRASIRVQMKKLFLRTFITDDVTYLPGLIFDLRALILQRDLNYNETIQQINAVFLSTDDIDFGFEIESLKTFKFFRRYLIKSIDDQELKDLLLASGEIK